MDGQTVGKSEAQGAGINGVSPAVEGTVAVAEKAPETMKVISGGKVPFREKDETETDETKRLKENYRFFGPATLGYALLYVFCTYKNPSGITFPLFIAGSLAYFYFGMKKLEIPLKRGRYFYEVSVILLAIATFCTDDARIIALNKTGIFLLMISFLLSQFFDVSKWGLGKFATAIPKLLLSSIGELPRPVEDMVGFAKKKRSKGTGKGLYVALGMMAAMPLLFIVLALLSSADVLFRQMTNSVIVDVDFSTIFGVIIRIVFWYFASYMLTSILCKKTISEEVEDNRKGEPILAITVTGMLTLVYLLFSGIQIFGLFLGQMKLPEGYTYAAYAREGFFQLLAVAIINLVIVLFCLAYFRESKVLKAILTVTSLCTFIMIASSAMRMILYVESYNLTFLRIIVLWALAVLFLLFVGVVIQIFQEKFPLFRYGMTVVTVFYVALAFSHPDAIVAKYNLSNQGGSLDYEYLAELSADAAPVLIPYLKEQGYDVSLALLAEEKGEEKAEYRNGKVKQVNNPFWKQVMRNLDGEYPTTRKKDSFGYFFLCKVRNDKMDMGLRNFNLSRFLAIKAAQK